MRLHGATVIADGKEPTIGDEIARGVSFLMEWSGHNAGGHLDVYVREIADAIREVAESVACLARVIEEQADPK